MLILFIIAITLLFAGRRFIRGLAFLISGLAGAAVGGTLSVYFGVTGTLVGVLGGFLAGALLSLILLPLGIGFAVAYYGYSMAREAMPNQFAALTVSLILFLASAYLAGRVLSLVSVILGGLLLIGLMESIGVVGPLATAVAGVLAVVGLWAQTEPALRKAGQTAPSGTPRTDLARLFLTILLISIIVFAGVFTLPSYLAKYDISVPAIAPNGSPASLSSTATGSQSSGGSGISASTSMTSSSTSTGTPAPANAPLYSVQPPSITNGSANLTYPPGYATLENYTLGLINHDRAGSGLNPVSPSAVQSGQQHANSMLYYGYFSHWDTQGYKPYMRYTLMGGVGAVEENVAYEYWSGPHYFTIQDLEKSLADLEYQMMYNDSACCNNGHRANILGSLHNRVSIGIAYDRTHVYLVEDFENYAQLSWTVSSSYSVELSGTLLSESSPSQLAIFYDSYPTPESVSQLNVAPHSYDQGTFIGGVLPPCTISCSYYPGHITIRASAWQFHSNLVNVQFSLTKFVQQYGAGVYTMYLQSGTDPTSEITSISIFVHN